MNFPKDNILMIFVKYPFPGQVKTRLSKSIGIFNACKVYECFVSVIIERTFSDSYESCVYFTPEDKKKQTKKWLGNKCRLFSQQGDTLGLRLKQAFSDSFKAKARKVVVIGSDSPLIDRRLIEKAFSELDENDCVIGPSSDGGYYLLGLKKNTPDIFDISGWSTDNVFKQTKARVENNRLKLSLLEEHFDIDEKNDLDLLIEKLDNIDEMACDDSLSSLRNELKKIARDY